MTKRRIMQWLGLVMIFTLLITATGSPGAVKAQDGIPNPDGTSVNSIQPTAPVEPALNFPKSTPSYDSGWIAIDANTTKTLTHSLGGDAINYIVDLRFYSQNLGYNQVMYGGNDFIDPAPSPYAVGDQVGGYWSNLTNTSIKVTRRPDDVTYMVKFRLRIWVDTGYVASSGWVNIAQNTAHTFNYPLLSGNVEDYLVVFDFLDNAALGGYGINQIAYGGNTTSGGTRAGAYWRSFTTSNITVYRRPGDIYVDLFRVRIFQNPKPTFDSGWVNTNIGSYIYPAHNIGGHPDEYFVDVEFKDAAINGGTDQANGINQRCYGGCDFHAVDTPFPTTKQGAYWSSLTKSSISIGRRVDDLFADQVRVRIWHFAKLPRPAFDSGWKSPTAGFGYTNYHNLGGNVDDYLVYLTFKDPTYWVHQMYYGSTVFGTNFPAGYAANQVAGGYWHELDTDSISIHRADNDDQADQYRVVIFKMPKPDYDSGWVTTSGHTHDLGGSVSDYLVDMTCKTSGGDINQMYYGSQHLADNTRVGAYYWGLSTTGLTFYRQPDDTQCATHRIRIWRMAVPAYTSGYFAIAQNGYMDKTHNLGLGTEKVLVDVTAHNSNGDHKMFYGRTDMGTSPPGAYVENDRVGYMWYSLNSAMIRTYRLSEDATVDTLNVRIWTLPTTIFLPIALK